MSDSPSSSDGFPRRSARTQRFSLGAPRSVQIAGDRVTFLRSRSGTDRVTCLWALDADATERLVVDPQDLLGGSDAEDLSPQERARRERAREGAGGIVGYSLDRDGTVAAFALSSRLWLADVAAGGARELPAAGAVVDPRPDPTGAHVAYVADGALHVVAVGSSAGRVLAAEDDEDVTWGLAEFVAAEEMGRSRGYWWSPDGRALLAARSDTSGVQRWWTADPSHPERPASAARYPAAGTPNAVVTLTLLALDGGRTAVEWDREAFPYLVTVTWTSAGGPLLLVQSRDQRTTRVLGLDPTTGTTRVRRTDSDPAWVEVVPGVPALLPDGRLVTVADSTADGAQTVDGDGARRLLVDGQAVTPPSVQVRAVLAVDEAGVLLSGSTDPVSTQLWRWSPDGALVQLTHGQGLHSGVAGGDLLVVATSTLDQDGSSVAVHRAGEQVAVLASSAQSPGLVPRVELLRLGERALSTALLLPTGWEPSQGPLPVLMDPYGGPHAQRVLAARGAFTASQWLADQGFAVVVVDGRGTPGRGPVWERAVHGDLATPVLADQVDALHALALARPDVLDLARVGIRGWSFGGYLAALAVLRRPDVFSAAVAGAPVVDWALYDTHYTERYLGTPAQAPEAYRRSSLLADAARLERPLMLVHGLADDNVVAAHTLRMSSALLEAGRPHTVLPLSGVTHMTPQEVVAENLLLLQVQFLREALGV